MTGLSLISSKTRIHFLIKKLDFLINSKLKMLFFNKILAYLLAFLLTIVAIIFRIYFIEYFQGHIYITLFPAIVISTLVGGMGPGLACIIFGGIASFYIFVPYSFSHFSVSLSDAITFIVYNVISIYYCLTIVKLQKVSYQLKQEKSVTVAALERQARLTDETKTLLKEFRHRTGNNLQMIASLLYLQSHSIKSTDAKNALNQAADRITLLEKINRDIYDFGKDNVDLHILLQKFCPNIVAAGAQDNVKLTIETEPVQSSAECIVPLILIVNELICNSIEHGFPNGIKGNIHVSLKNQRENTKVLTIIDNGKGVPSNFDLEHTKSLGLNIVKCLSQQISGEFSLKTITNRGTMATLIFPDSCMPNQAA